MRGGNMARPAKAMAVSTQKISKEEKNKLMKMLVY